MSDYRVLTSRHGIVHRGPDRGAAERAYGAAVREIEESGEGSALLMSGTRILERHQKLQPARGFAGWRRS
jgi:hypothetical protein